MDMQERIQKIQRENNQKKEEKNRIEGRLEALLQQAKEEFGVNTVEELEDKIKEIEPQLVQQEQEINEKLEKMEAYANI
jgi:seryl-tRNA synthetase